MSENVILADIECPICKEKIKIPISLENLRRVKTKFVKVLLKHGDPEHLAIIYVDQNGNVIAITGSKDLDIPEVFSLTDLVTILGERKVAYIMFWLLAGKKVHIFSGIGKIDRMVEDFIITVLNLPDQLALEPQKDALVINPMDPPKPSVNVDVLENTLIEAEKVGVSPSQEEWLREIFSMYLRAQKKMRKLLESEKTWKLKELIDKTGFSLAKEEAILLLEALRLQGVRISGKITDANFKIRDLFL